jgi:hypothetical protein
MKHINRLREVCKFLSGIVAADLIVGIWLLASGSLPATMFGMWITVPYAWLWASFDVFALLVLVHYAWTPKFLEPHATSKGLFFVTGVIFAAVAVVHLLRLIFSWPVVIDGWAAPLWISWVGVIVAAYISYASFHFAAKHGKTI